MKLGACGLALLAGLAGFAPGCAPGEAPAAGTAIPQRIVSLAPSVTEMLFAAGAGDQVVGVTRWCTWPPAAQTRPHVGGLEIDLEQIVALRPDAVFSAPLAHRANDEVRHLGLPLCLVETSTLAEVTAELRRLGDRTGHHEFARHAADELERRIAAVVRRVAGRRTPSVFFEAGGEPMLTAGPRSFVDDALRVAGGRNVMDHLERPWSTVAWERVVALDPEVILVAHDTPGLERRAGWNDLRAVRTGRVHRVPKESFFFATPRLVDGLELLAKCCHGP